MGFGVGALVVCAEAIATKDSSATRMGVAIGLPERAMARAQAATAL